MFVNLIVLLLPYFKYFTIGIQKRASFNRLISFNTNMKIAIRGSQKVLIRIRTEYNPITQRKMTKSQTMVDIEK